MVLYFQSAIKKYLYNWRSIIFTATIVVLLTVIDVELYSDVWVRRNSNVDDIIGSTCYLFLVLLFFQLYKKMRGIQTSLPYVSRILSAISTCCRLFFYLLSTLFVILYIESFLGCLFFCLVLGYWYIWLFKRANKWTRFLFLLIIVLSIAHTYYTIDLDGPVVWVISSHYTGLFYDSYELYRWSIITFDIMVKSIVSCGLVALLLRIIKYIKQNGLGVFRLAFSKGWSELKKGNKTLILWIVILILYYCFNASCTSRKINTEPENIEAANEKKTKESDCFIKIHGLDCPITTCAMGEKILIQQRLDSMLVKHSYEIKNDSSFFSLSINLDYIEPDIKLSWFSEGDSERRWISVALCHWENSLLEKKPKVYIPKTLNWTGDSLCNYYGKRFIRNKDSIKGNSYASISIVKRSENPFFATYYVQEEEYLGGAHEMYRYWFATISKSDCLGIPLSLKKIVASEFQDIICSMVATQLELLTKEKIQKEDYKIIKNAHVAFVPEGIVFSFFPYELACFSAGNLFVILPYKEVAHMLNSIDPLMTKDLYEQDGFAR